MSIPINKPITYTAVAQTQGLPLDVFSYSWAFDDSTTGNTASVAKTWTTSGNHLATVTAVDTLTGGNASASKSIRVISSWITDSVVVPAYSCNFYSAPIVPLSSVTSLIIGSRADNNTTVGNTCYIYNPISHTISQTGTIPSRVYTSESSTCLMADGNVLLTGAYISGSTGGAETLKTFIYNANSGVWAQVASRAFPCEYGSPYTSVLMPNGKVFSASTQSSTGNRNEIYDPTNNSWSTTALMPSGCSYNDPSVVMMDNGKVFRGPGVHDTRTGCSACDPISGIWSSLAVCPSSQLRIVKLTSGKLFGVDLGTSPTNAFIYDTTTNIWSSVAGVTMTTPAGYPTLFATSDGRAIYMRGSTNVKAYDPTTDSWYDYPSLNSQHPYANIGNNSDILFTVGSGSGSTSIEYLV